MMNSRQSPFNTNSSKNLFYNKQVQNYFGINKDKIQQKDQKNNSQIIQTQTETDKSVNVKKKMMTTLQSNFSQTSYSQNFRGDHQTEYNETQDSFYPESSQRNRRLINTKAQLINSNKNINADGNLHNSNQDLLTQKKTNAEKLLGATTSSSIKSKHSFFQKIFATERNKTQTSDQESQRSLNQMLFGNQTADSTIENQKNIVSNEHPQDNQQTPKMNFFAVLRLKTKLNGLRKQQKEKIIEQKKVKKKKKTIQPRYLQNLSSGRQLDQQDEEDYNIYGQIKNIIDNTQIQLKRQLRRFQFTNILIEFMKQDSRRAINSKSINMEKEIQMSRVIYHSLCENTINIMFNIIPILQNAMDNIGERNMLDDYMNQIIQESQKTKNICLFIICANTQAKLCQEWKNYQKAISLYQQVKNASDLPFLLKIRMRCYKNLGRCFNAIKQYKLALIYYGKMLQMAWYLKDIEKELKAYDYIGVQYYYLGQVQKAQYYHKKMLFGIYEEDNSDMKMLGISKVESRVQKKLEKTTAKGEQKIMNQKYIKSTENEELALSSSDEEFELPMPTEANQGIVTEFKPEQKPYDPYAATKNKFFLAKEKKKFEVVINIEDKRQMEQVIDKANHNIKIGLFMQQQKELRPEDNDKEGFKLNIQSFKPIKEASKIPLRINHLSVNRDIDNYSYYDPRVARVLGHKYNDVIYDQFEKLTKIKLYYILKKLQDNIILSVGTINLIMNQLKSTDKRRRFAISIAQFPIIEELEKK